MPGPRREVGLFEHERAVLDEGVARGIEVVLTFRHRRVGEKRRGVDRIATRGLLQDALGFVGLVVTQQRPAVERHDLARCVSHRRHTLERLDRLAERDTPFERRKRFASRDGDIEPDPAERGVGEGLAGRPLQRLAERQHRQLGLPVPGLGQAEIDLTLRPRAVEARDGLQFLELVAPLVEDGVERRQFLAGGDETGRQRDGFFERRHRVRRSRRIDQAQAEEVVGFGVGFVHPDGLLGGRRRARQVPGPVAGERQLVGHTRRCVVEPKAFLVGFDGAREPAPFVQRVAERFEGPRRRGIDRGRTTEIPRGGFEISATPVCLATPQVREHRGGPKRDGSAVGLDRLEGVIAGERGVATCHERTVVALTRGRLVREARRYRAEPQKRHDCQQPFHNGTHGSRPRGHGELCRRAGV